MSSTTSAQSASTPFGVSAKSGLSVTPSAVPATIVAQRPVPSASAIAVHTSEDQTSDPFWVASEINKLLSGLSNTKVKVALAAVAAPHNIRIVSMDRPIGSVQGTIVPQGSSNKKSKSVVRLPSWKQDPRFVAATAEHKRLVDLIKSTTDIAAKAEMVDHLRQQEAAIRILKQQLKGAVPNE